MRARGLCAPHAPSHDYPNGTKYGDRTFIYNFCVWILSMTFLREDARTSECVWIAIHLGIQIDSSMTDRHRCRQVLHCKNIWMWNCQNCLCCKPVFRSPNSWHSTLAEFSFLDFFWRTCNQVLQHPAPNLMQKVPLWLSQHWVRSFHCN